ncbi:MAG: glycosyltransferase [Candidatus Bathyarchaeota archaeon]|nr:MAG: glycosyltransferase [Candidatus Bathyarchaeota archaeon]
MEKTSLSVIVPTLNEEENLGKCIKSLFAQTNQGFEVIVADGGSTDATVEIAESSGLSVIDVEKTRPHDVSTAKNLGVKHASGDILFFLDADMSVEPNCFEVIEEGYQDPDVVGVALKVMPYDASRVEKMLYECNNYLARFGNLIGFHEISYFSCHSYKKDAFMSVGGFRTDLYACEDLDLSLRMRRQGRYVVTPKTILWTSPRRLREWSKGGYIHRYMKYLAEYYLYDRVTEFYDDI